MGGVSSRPFNLIIYFHRNIMLQHLFKLDGFMWSPNVSFTGEFSPNPYLKNMIGPIGRIFHEKNGPNSSDFEKTILPITRFLLLVPVGSQK
jgi:hypothetical protein